MMLPLDRNRYHTIVVSGPAERPKNATRESGVPWIDWGQGCQSESLIPLGVVETTELVDGSVADHRRAVRPGQQASDSCG